MIGALSIVCELTFCLAVKMQAPNPPTETVLVRAAQDVRASTDHQQYSIENQSLAIANYATEHNMQVIQTYTDEGKSGLTLRKRQGSRQLLQDVENGKVQFSIILVYDVSRWGRLPSRVTLRILIIVRSSRGTTTPLPSVMVSRHLLMKRFRL